MGYEVTFYFKEKDKETGEYKDGGNFKKRVGDPYEDTSIESLANIVLRQLARRDILVDNVDVFEITKKKISFKESKSGIVIKNKKFTLDDSFEIKSEEEQNEETGSSTSDQAQPKNKEKLSTSKLKPIKRMIYAPEPQQHIKLLKQGVKLTVDKEYDIFQIQKHPNGITEIYLIVDDKGRDKQVADDCFVPQTFLLDEGVDEHTGLSDDGLNWGGAINDSVPSIR
jgi:hypothetical protein